MRILLTLLALILAFSAFAAEEKAAKDTAIALKGEKTPGAGYKVYFSDDKSSFVNLWGYSRLQTSFSLDDKQSSDAGKFTMPYFRLFLDGQSDKNWSWHTRFDYSQAWSMSRQTKVNDAQNPDKKTYGAASIYFARAYLTYKANDNFSVDFGRISNQIYRFDVISGADIKVGFGVMPKFTYNDFSFTTTINYSNEAQRMGPTTDNTIDGVAANQIVTLGGRAGYNYKFNKDYSLAFGMMVNGDTQHSYEKFVQLMPDFMLNGPHESYLLNQSLKKIGTRNTLNYLENYTEVGFGIDGFIYPDINYTLTRGLDNNGAKLPTKHTIAAEIYLKHSPSISTFYTVIYDDYLADLKADKSKTAKAWIQYDF